MRFTSVNGLGAAMECGFVQNGFTLVHRAGSLELGAPLARANRPILGWEWEDSFTKDYREWPRHDVPIITANPPCSGWSTLTRKDLRGEDAKVMSCTQEVIDYAAILPQPPLMVAIESVQQAYGMGRSWYNVRREQLSEMTGQDYDLVWVMQSNASMGGASVRKRVFVVYTRIPFGVEHAQPKRVARLGDAIRDLQGLTLTASWQSYRRPSTWWSVPLRAADGTDGHFVQEKLNAPYVETLRQLEAVGERWTPGQSTGDVLKILYTRTGKIPEHFERHLPKFIAKDWDLGLNQTVMWNPDKQSPVVTGRGPHHSVHWSEPRLLTHRECARIQGFPDTWRIWPARDYAKLNGVWGKGVPVDAGRWLGRWVKLALEDNPGTVRGEPIGPRERMIDLTGTYRRTLKLERPWEHQSWVLHEHEPWIDSRNGFTSAFECDMM